MFALPSYGQIAVNVTGNNASSDKYRASVTINTTGQTAIHAILSYYQYSSSASITMQDNMGSTWVQDTVVKQSGDAAIISFHCSTCITSATHTFSVSAVSSSVFQYPALVVMATTGENAGGAKDKATGKTLSSGTTITSTTLTPSNNNELIISAVNTSNQTLTSGTGAPSGYTLVYSVGGGANFAGISVYYQIQGTATATSPTYSWGSNAAASLLTVAFPQLSASTTNSNFLMFFPK